ncbi:LacI family DNA-binding transcriptional regulator [Peribacillus sp. TH27]|nr:LacI family DNA-binding transcriptional regulator [Peribacillus sp. TH27]
MEKKVTIRDVARYTGVSRTTVSNIVNGINKTSEETKRKSIESN